MKHEVLLPQILFYNQDIVDLYDRAWDCVSKSFITKKSKKGAPIENYITNPNHKTFNYFYSLMPSFFLVYSSEEYSASDVMDFFYKRQEEDGAIYSDYDVNTGEKVENEGVTIPIFAWVEWNYYIRYGNKKRLKEVAPKLVKFYEWFKGKYMDETGLFRVPNMIHITGNVDRKDTCYPVDLNAAMAMFCNQMADIGSTLNDKDVKLSFKKQYFALKKKIREMMWKDSFFYDLNEKREPVGPELITAYITLLSDICEEREMRPMLSHLRDTKMFNTENVFPTIPANCKKFSNTGDGFNGGVSSILTFIVIKALEKCGEMELAKESTLRHAYFIVEALNIKHKDIPADFWDIYRPNGDGPSIRYDSKKNIILPRQHFVPAIGLIAITLFIEIIIGLDVSMLEKIVIWTMSDYELLGITNFYLKKNYISFECVQENGEWIIKLNTDKLYYFELRVLKRGIKKRIPMPAGKATILLEKWNNDDYIESLKNKKSDEDDLDF